MLVEFDYFTVLKANGAKPVFRPPRDYGMTFDNGQVTLAFVLPLKTPARANKVLTLEVYYPSFFVSVQHRRLGHWMRSNSPTRFEGLQIGRGRQASMLKLERSSARNSWAPARIERGARRLSASPGF